MSVDLAVSERAPALQIELNNDMQHGLGRYCERFGRRPMTQAGLKCLQAIPIAHAALAVKESAKMSAATRNAAMSKCYQEISAPGWIRVLQVAEVQGFRFPTDYKDRLYYTTLGTGVCGFQSKHWLYCTRLLLLLAIRAYAWGSCVRSHIDVAFAHCQDYSCTIGIRVIVGRAQRPFF